jgi:hypothetical protein
MIRSKIFLFSSLACVILAHLANALTSAADAEIAVPRIAAEELKQKLGNKNVVIIDVRSDRTYWSSSKKIAGAKREVPGLVKQWAKKYTKDQTLIFYCT